MKAGTRESSKTAIKKESLSLLGKPKILFIDIEATALNAAFGHLLCVGYKWLGDKKIYCPSLLSHPGKQWNDDSALAKHIHGVMTSADIWITYYGRRYDERFIQTRLLIAQSADRKSDPAGYILPHMGDSHIDVWFTSKYRLKLNSNRLASLIDTLELDNEKTPVKGHAWQNAQSSDSGPKAMPYIIDHCRKDILTLEEAYILLRPLIGKHPRVNGYGPCQSCGSSKIQFRGRAMTVGHGQRQRIQCTECGHWENRAIDNKTEELVGVN